MRSAIILPVFILLSAASCHKHHNPVADPAKVDIEFISPQSGQSFKKGDAVNIKANVSYTEELHGYEVLLINTATNTTLFTTEKHVHGGQFSINETWTDTLSAHADIKVNIKVAIDHGNITEKSVHIKSTP